MHHSHMCRYVQCGSKPVEVSSGMHRNRHITTDESEPQLLNIHSQIVRYCSIAGNTVCEALEH